MPDLDRLAQQLRYDLSRTTWPEPARLRAAAGRRTARRLAAAAGLAVLVVVAAVALAIGPGRAPHVTPLGPPATAPTANGPTATGPAPTSTAPTSAAGGLTPRQVFFTGPDSGWLLGLRPCSAGSCLALLHTVDGGHTWTTLPALPADVPTDGTAIRFADARTGYLYAPSVLYLTTDGGATWRKQAGGANAIDVADGTVLRISSSSPGCPPGCHYEIARAPVGSANWQTMRTDAGGGVAADLRRVGHRAVAVVYRNVAGGTSAHAVLLTSADDGATWSTRTDPCGTSGGVERAATGMTMAPDGSTTVLCVVRGAPDPAATLVTTSTDGGGSFGPARPTPGPGEVLTVGAAGASTLFVSGLDGHSNRLYRSGDGGATWQVVATAPEPVPDGAVAPTSIAFMVDGRTGFWLPGYQTIFSTTDGGRVWTPGHITG